MRNPLTPHKSDFLDFVRWFAALAVVLGHVEMYLGWFRPHTEGGVVFGYFSAHAHSAVIVFFVLSGYVVAYATENKDAEGGYGFRSYLLDRWSRIYSVLLAAIGFTLFLDIVGSAINPSVYRNPEILPQDYFLLRLFANLSSLQGIWGYRIQFGSNPTLWSVGYEFIYYVLYGVLFFRASLFRGRWTGPIIVAVALVFIGPKMATYFAVWMFGVVAYRLSCSERIRRHAVNGWLVFSALLGANHFLVFSDRLDAPETVRDLLFSVAIALVLTIEIDRFPLALRGWRIHKYLASFSYSVYAFHTPIIVFLCSTLLTRGLYLLSPTVAGLILAIASILLAWMLSRVTEARRTQFRSGANRTLQLLRL